MENKYTIGELARDTGITVKALRVYENSGLIQPVSYTDSNYRLYDENSKIIIQKILTMKYVGFSLKEIKKRFEIEKGLDIKTSLSFQKKILLEKKEKLDRVIKCVERAEKMCSGTEIDWTSVSDIIGAVVMDQNADERHFFYEKHNTNMEDWYVQIFRRLEIKEGESILDVGCGYGKIWRNNIDILPKALDITLVDMHGTWADDFEKYIDNIKEELPKDINFSFVWGDIEKDNIIKGKYKRIIANYFLQFLKNKRKFMEDIKGNLEDGGVFTCNGDSIGLLEFLQKVFIELKLNDDFINELIIKRDKGIENQEKELGSIFKVVERMELESQMTIDKGEDLYLYFVNSIKDMKDMFKLEKDEMITVFDELVQQNGSLVINKKTYFYNCG